MLLSLSTKFPRSVNIALSCDHSHRGMPPKRHTAAPVLNEEKKQEEEKQGEEEGEQKSDEMEEEELDVDALKVAELKQELIKRGYAEEIKVTSHSLTLINSHTQTEVETQGTTCQQIKRGLEGS